MKPNQNFLIAMLLSFAVIWGWQYFYVEPHTKMAQLEALHHTASPVINTADLKPFTDTIRTSEVNAKNRILISTPSLSGSINLYGAKFDDLSLKQYHITVDKNSAPIRLLAPQNYQGGYTAEYDFVSNTPNIKDLPNATTKWQLVGANTVLTENTPIQLSYTSNSGLCFERTISVDDKFMFTINDSITNKSSSPITISSYGNISRQEAPKDVKNSYLLHEGLIGVVGDQGLQEKKYKDLKKLEYNAQGQKSVYYPTATGGYIGITDKYWAVTAIPNQLEPFTSSFSYLNNSLEHFQATITSKSITINPNQKISVSNNLFAGAKKVQIINSYQDKYHIEKFNLLIDWGIFSFITKPMFVLIDYLYKLTGNFGAAILLVTVILKIILFPLSNKSYSSMAKMRELQPSIENIKSRYKDDKPAQQKAIIELYRKEKINPMAGCVPMLIQMPIFFALYKVLYITIEMRHAPFFGWIKDLAAPDPTSIFNLFGLLHFQPPHFLMIGVWPILMGVTMFIQMRINPSNSVDPMQAKMLTWMPLVFTFMLSSFPVGLVVYWAWNNTLTIIQQIAIIKKNGGKVELFNNLKALFKSNTKK